jgi:phenylpropionate dioxygenase-like ring-hydroxylating dioxygenase large terminal subunit
MALLTHTHTAGRYIRNCWYVASWSRDLIANRPEAMAIGEEPLVLFRDEAGKAVTLRDCCCHRNAPLSLGRCESGRLRCMYHGLVFDGTGKCVSIPGQQHVPASYQVRSYPTEEAGGWVWVWLGDPARADPQLIPPAAIAETAEWDLRMGKLDFEANYQLLNDNLCDFSHVAFVHEGTFAGGDRRIAETHPRITHIERGIRVERWLTERGAIEPWLGPEAAPRPDDTPGRHLDQWLTYDYLVPGLLAMRSEVHRAGTAKASNFNAPISAPLHAEFTRQAITPMTGSSSRYFFSMGPRASETQDQPALPDQMLAGAQHAFHEDRKILEAQQRNLERWPLETTSGVIRHDRGVHIFRSMIERLIADENTTLAPRDVRAG